MQTRQTITTITTRLPVTTELLSETERNMHRILSTANSLFSRILRANGERYGPIIIWVTSVIFLYVGHILALVQMTGISEIDWSPYQQFRAAVPSEKYVGSGPGLQLCWR